MKQVQHNGFLLVEVPEGVENIEVESLPYSPKNKGYYATVNGLKELLFTLSRKWEIVGMAKDLTEEQWKEIVDPLSNNFFKDYDEKNIWDLSGFEGKDTATTSGHSLLAHHGLTESNTLILKQVK